MTAATHEIDRQEAFSSATRVVTGRYPCLKAGIDFVAALFLLVILSPLLFVLMVLVRITSRGPAVYTQRRLGRDGRVFTILKLRSMYSDSERDGIRWSRPGDTRVTPLGKFLRASHFDELPQLLNVLKGEMSLVGPRPERPEIVAQLEQALPDYRLRLQVRPGLTGLAQVLQPPDTDLDSVRRKLDYDLTYLDGLTFRLDFKILLATVLVLMAIPSRVIATLFRFPYEPEHAAVHYREGLPIESVESIA